MYPWLPWNYVDQAGLNLTEISLPLFPMPMGVHHHAQLLEGFLKNSNLTGVVVYTLIPVLKQKQLISVKPAWPIYSVHMHRYVCVFICMYQPSFSSENCSKKECESEGSSAKTLLARVATIMMKSTGQNQIMHAIQLPVTEKIWRTGQSVREIANWSKCLGNEL